MNKNINLLIEFSREMGVDYVDEEILDCMTKILEGGMNPNDLVNLINHINLEIEGTNKKL
jgi:hypothetical protein